MVYLELTVLLAVQGQERTACVDSAVQADVA